MYEANSTPTKGTEFPHRQLKIKKCRLIHLQISRTLTIPKYLFIKKFLYFILIIIHFVRFNKINAEGFFLKL